MTTLYRPIVWWTDVVGTYEVVHLTIRVLGVLRLRHHDTDAHHQGAGKRTDAEHGVVLPLDGGEDQANEIGQQNTKRDSHLHETADCEWWSCGEHICRAVASVVHLKGRTKCTLEMRWSKLADIHGADDRREADSDADHLTEQHYDPDL